MIAGIRKNSCRLAARLVIEAQDSPAAASSMCIRCAGTICPAMARTSFNIARPWCIDLTTLATTFPKHKHFGTFCSNPAAGGVTVSIGGKLVAATVRFEVKTIYVGRILAVTCHRTSGRPVVVICLHLVPEWTDKLKREVLQKVRRAARPPSEAMVVLGGDFNHLVPGEMRMDTITGREVTSSTAMGDFFANLFPDFAEVLQSNPTRRQIFNGVLAGTSRIDRVYVNLPPHELLDRGPKAALLGNTSDLRFPSDHLPVIAHLAGPPSQPPAQPRLHGWTGRHADYKEALAEKMVNLGFEDETTDPFTRLRFIKVAMHGAAAVVRAAGRKAEDDDHRLHCALAAARAYRAGDVAAVSRQGKVHEGLTLFFSHEGCLLDEDGFADHIAELVRATIHAQLVAKYESETDHECKKEAKRQMLHRRLAAWSPHRRRAGGLTIVRPDGTPELDHRQLRTSSSNIGGKCLVRR